MNKSSENHLKTGGETLEFKEKAADVYEPHPDCVVAFNSLKIRRKYSFLKYKINDNTIIGESVGDKKLLYNDFRNSLPYSECRFCVYDHDFFTEDKRKQSKLWFISWLPKNATPQNKMSYACAKSRFHEFIPGTYDVQVTRYFIKSKQYSC